MRAALVLIVLAGLARAQDSPEQLFRDAVEAQKRGDDARAVRKYQDLVKLRPDVLAVRANLGAALAHLGRFDEAIGAAQMAGKLAAQSGDEKLLRRCQNLLKAYTRHEPFREAPAQDAF